MSEHRPWDHNINSVCPICRAVHDGMASMLDTRGPEDGDVNMCIFCGGVSIYQHDIEGRLRFATDEELVAINENPQMKLLLWAHRETVRRYGRPKGDYHP